MYSNDSEAPGASSYYQVAPKPQQMYGVVLSLPDDFAEEIAARREKLNPRAPHRIFPHITLRAPFTADDPKSLPTVLEDVALRYLPVQVAARGLGAFVGSTNNVIYTKVERSPRLVRLHEAIVEALPNVRNVYSHATAHQFENWIPHITIVDGISEERLREMQNDLAEYVPEAEWEAREIVLVRSESDDLGSLRWTSTRAFRIPA